MHGVLVYAARLGYARCLCMQGKLVHAGKCLYMHGNASVFRGCLYMQRSACIYRSLPSDVLHRLPQHIRDYTWLMRVKTCIVLVCMLCCSSLC
jgi:hypothetical protein